MAIKQISIYGFRGFAEEQILPFAMPNGKAGSGLNIIVGPNNAGKSTIVEAFIALTSRQTPSFNEGQRNAQTGDRVSIRIEDGLGSVSQLQTVDEGGSETAWGNTAIPDRTSCYVLPSRRFFSPFFSRNIMIRQQYLQSRDLPATRGGPIELFEARLFEVQKRRAEFNRLFEEIVGYPLDWMIEQSGSGRYYVKLRFGTADHNSDGLGEGLVSLLFITDALFEAQEGQTIVVDEPELSLYPGLQRRLAKVFARHAAQQQIIITTHSPYFVDIESIVGGAQVARVVRTRAGSRIHALGHETSKRLTGLMNDKNNPHVLGLNARETFFLEDGVILVEGQEDVIFYRQLLGQFGLHLDGEFFGWGVGGADKMGIIARILGELGYERVVGILDRNKDDLRASLCQDYPQYRFFCIPADDIRTKSYTHSREPIAGILDEHGKIRPQYEKETRRVLVDVADALRSRDTSCHNWTSEV
jgi:hypothetical protein